MKGRRNMLGCMMVEYDGSSNWSMVGTFESCKSVEDDLKSFLYDSKRLRISLFEGRLGVDLN